MRIIGSHTQNNTLAAAQTIDVPPSASHLLIQPLSQNVRLTLDGTVPTAALGFQIAAGSEKLLPIESNGQVKVIEEAAGASIEYQFLGA